MDEATPAGNSMSAWNLARLFKLTGDVRWRSGCNTLLTRATDLMHKYPSAFPLMNMALLEIHGKSLVVMGAFDVQKLSKTLSPLTWTGAHPTLLKASPILQGKQAHSGETLYYLCEGEQCQLPTSDFEGILRELKA